MALLAGKSPSAELAIYASYSTEWCIHIFVYKYTPSHLEIPHLTCVTYNDVMLYILWIVVPTYKFVIVSSSSCLQI